MNPLPPDTALARRQLLGAGALLGLLALPWGRALAAAPQAAETADWPRVAALLERYVGQRQLPGALAAMGWGSAPLTPVARGLEGFDDADPVGPASLFRIYSMTKPITGMAAMMLIDEGKLGLDQPLAEILPEFARMQVALDPLKGLESRAATTPITVRHLLTHTAGFGYAGVVPDRVSEELLRQGVAPAVVSRQPVPGLTPPGPVLDRSEFLRRAAAVPLVAEPGTKWRYSMSYDILGLAIERAAGAKNLAHFLHERLFAPLGMASTWFRLPRREAARLTTGYARRGNAVFALDPAKTSAYFDRPPFAYGGAGLVTSPADYDRFLMMLLGKGALGGVRVMSERAVAMGLSNLLPADADTAGTQIAGAGFGAGGRVGLGADEGSFGWSGAAGTTALINTRVGLRAALYIQLLPPGALPIQREFMAAARDDAQARAVPVDNENNV